ncbi:MAG TPA: carboxymuconolactone decarboxylase family protein [Planctomycetota bacterium]|nr:carboxymuconolactone decarboxylase family protein [Planctomycetota bacterium]
MDRKEIYAEATKLLGRVPGFIETVPDDLLSPRWEEFRKVQLEETEIPPKFKQLIMLAVSTYAKCPYCIDFHTEAAKLFGATQEEIVETACLTGNTALWSSFLNGIRYPKEKFQEELDATCEHVRKGQAAQKERKPVAAGVEG